MTTSGYSSQRILQVYNGFAEARGWPRITAAKLLNLRRQGIVPGPVPGPSRGYRRGVPQLWSAMTLRRLTQLSRLSLDRTYRARELKAALWVSGSGVGISPTIRNDLASSVRAELANFARKTHADTWSQERLARRPPKFVSELTRSIVDPAEPTGLIQTLASQGASGETLLHLEAVVAQPQVAAFIRWFFTSYFTASEDVKRRLMEAAHKLPRPARVFLGDLDQLVSGYAGLLSGNDIDMEEVIRNASTDRLLLARRWTWLYANLGGRSRAQLRDLIKTKCGLGDAVASTWAASAVAVAATLRPKTPDHWLLIFTIALLLVENGADLSLAAPRPAA